jgi:hypothetical protein
MSLPARSPLRRKIYVFAAAAALALLSLGLLAGVRAQAVMSKPASFWWSVTTGAVLLGCVVYQWTLLLARMGGHMTGARRRYQRHRPVGAAGICLFALHAGGVGYAFVTVLAVVFLIVSVTGVLNTEVLPLNRPWLKRCWSYLHIGLSGLLFPLLVLHVWAALAFK